MLPQADISKLTREPIKSMESSTQSPNKKLRKRLKEKCMDECQTEDEVTSDEEEIDQLESIDDHISAKNEILKSDSSFSKYWFLIIPVIVLICLFAFQNYLPLSSQNYRVLNISSILSDMKSEFSGQPSQSFKIVEVAIKNLNIPAPKAPAIILFAAAMGAETMANDFANKLARAISPTFVSIKGNSLNLMEGGKAKLHIEESINSILQHDTLGVVYISNFNNMPYDAATMFYSLCDHENAPYKRAVYLMTVSTGETIPLDSVPKLWDKKAQDCLKKVWQEEHIDQVSALLTRITVNVVAILPKP